MRLIALAASTCRVCAQAVKRDQRPSLGHAGLQSLLVKRAGRPQASRDSASFDNRNQYLVDAAPAAMAAVGFMSVLRHLPPLQAA